MDSPHKRRKNRKKIAETNTSKTRTQSLTTSENTNIKKETKFKKKSDLKSGSVLGHQGAKAKCITIAGNVVDNTFLNNVLFVKYLN